MKTSEQPVTVKQALYTVLVVLGLFGGVFTFTFKAMAEPIPRLDRRIDDERARIDKQIEVRDEQMFKHLNRIEAKQDQQDSKLDRLMDEVRRRR
jgi:hypothetical protein